MPRKISTNLLRFESSSELRFEKDDLFTSVAESQAESQNTVSADDEAQDIKDSLASIETRQVFRLRFVVLLILVAAATSISVTVFFITRNAEKEEFQIQYYGIADKIIQAFQDVMVEISAVSGLAVAARAGLLPHCLSSHPSLFGPVAKHTYKPVFGSSILENS